jgi:branched-chain amino acid transport system permease protein
VPSASLRAQGRALGVLTGGVYALRASGLTLYFGVLRVVQIAHPAFLVLAAYLTYFLYTSLGVDPLLSILVTVPVYFVLGVLIQRLLLSRLRPDSFTMMSVLLTFALALLIEGGLGVVATGSFRSVTVDYAARALQFGPVRLPYDRLIGFAVAVATLALLFAILRYSRYGQALRATIQHREAARLVGIDTDRITAVGFGIGLATAAVGGAVLALITPFFPAAHWGWIARLMAIIVVGGLGSVSGAALAAVMLGVIEALVLVTLDATWAALVFYAFLFLTLVFRPQGFFGGRLAERF